MVGYAYISTCEPAYFGATGSICGQPKQDEDKKGWYDYSLLSLALSIATMIFVIVHISSLWASQQIRLDARVFGSKADSQKLEFLSSWPNACYRCSVSLRSTLNVFSNCLSKWRRSMMKCIQRRKFTACSTMVTCHRLVICLQTRS